MFGICLFALISIPGSSLTCSVPWELERGEEGLTLAGCTSQLASICIWPMRGTEGRWRAGEREKPRYFSLSFSASCGVSHRCGTSPMSLTPLGQVHFGSTFCQVAVHPGLWKDCPYPWLSSLRHGSSFLLLLISICLNFSLLASQLFHYLYNHFLKSFPSC